MEGKPDPFGRDAIRPLDIPVRGWWQVAERVLSESSRDNLSVVAAGCAFYALFAIFPALSALISLYGLVADPANIDQSFGMLGYVLPQQAYDIVIEQIRRVAQTLDQTLGWSLLLGLGLALWSANLLAQALFAALNIAYEEPERRNLFQFYLSAFTFTLLGILGGLVMLMAIVYVPILFASVGFSTEFEALVRLGRWPLLALLVLLLLALLYRFGPWRERQMALGQRWIVVRYSCVVARISRVLILRVLFCPDKTYGSLGAVIIFLFLVVHHNSPRRGDEC
jgi:membrane protein